MIYKSRQVGLGEETLVGVRSNQSRALSSRANWQKSARFTGDKSSDDFARISQGYLDPNTYVVTKPDKIHYPDSKYGFKLDILFINSLTRLQFLVEVKCQKDEGNAHERSYKFTPNSGITKYVREEILGVPYTPIGLVYSGDLITSLKYRSEINTMFVGFEEFRLFWNRSNNQEVYKYLEDVVLPRIDGRKID